MPEPKDRAIMVNLEETVYTALVTAIFKHNTTLSAFCRKLVIQDLLNQGLLTEEMIVKMTVK